MVEEKYSKISAILPENLISNGSSEHNVSKLWLSDNGISLTRSEEFYNSDSLNIELLKEYTSDEPVDSQNVVEQKKESIDTLFLETIPTIPNNTHLLSQDDFEFDSYFDDYGHTVIADDQDIMSSDIYLAVNSPDSFFGNAPLDSSKLDEAFKIDKDEIHFNPTLAEINANNNEAVFGSFDSFSMSLFSDDKQKKIVPSPVAFNTNSIHMPSKTDASQVERSSKFCNATNYERMRFLQDNCANVAVFDSFDSFSMPPLSDNKQKKIVSSPVAFNTTNSKQMPSKTDASKVEMSPKFCNATNYKHTRFVQVCASDYKNTTNSQCMCVKRVNSKCKCTKEIKTQTFFTNPAIVNNEIVTDFKQRNTTTESVMKTIDEKRIVHSSNFAQNNQETYDSEDDDSEMDCGYSSDIDEDSEEDVKCFSTKQGSAKNLFQKKNSRYFWQYNIQAKGPKAPKTLSRSCTIPDIPVISHLASASSSGIKCGGKIRRGDGNDFTPNPKKLYNIGIELEKLNSKIDGLVPANELPLSDRKKCRREKNKLASRACRLKKKAQHEANKLKLYGLQREKKHLLSIIDEVKQVIQNGISSMKHGKREPVLSKVEALIMKKRITEVAGRTAEYVNEILKNIASFDFHSLEAYNFDD